MCPSNSSLVHFSELKDNLSCFLLAILQHPLMPPYGTPVPYPMYPPGGVYAHPNMATVNLVDLLCMPSFFTCIALV